MKKVVSEDWILVRAHPCYPRTIMIERQGNTHEGGIFTPETTPSLPTLFSLGQKHLDGPYLEDVLS